jgi:hypothetical protein
MRLRLCIRQYNFYVRGHLQRVKQQLDYISQRPWATSVSLSCCITGAWIGVLCRRRDIRFAFAVVVLLLLYCAFVWLLWGKMVGVTPTLSLMKLRMMLLMVAFCVNRI